MHKAVFLDRDGTIIYDTGYPKDPEIIRLMPGVPEALSLIKQKGFKLIIVSNQSGIGRGILTENDVDRINERILLLLNLKGISIDGIYYCPITLKKHVVVVNLPLKCCSVGPLITMWIFQSLL